MSEVLKIPFSDVVGCERGKEDHTLRITSGSHRGDRNVMELASSVCVSQPSLLLPLHPYLISLRKSEYLPSF